MLSIKIDDIENAPSKSLDIEFDDKIADINSEGNVKANLVAKSLGAYIEITGNVNLIMKLECDRCLKEYTEKMDFEINEMFVKSALKDEYGQELELKSDQFMTDLNGEDEIDIEDLLYQSVILNLPNKKVCGINCNEGLFVTDEEFEIQDDRMSVFKNIKLDNK